jgi:hypothetical protein
MVNIKPGMVGEILIEDDGITDKMAGIPITVFSVAERRILLSQTAPPISDADLGKRLLLTYLVNHETSPLRYRFGAKLIGFADHEIAPSLRIPALVIERETHPEACNLRMNYRIKPATDRGLQVWLRGTLVPIVDISEGGVCIRAKGEIALKPRDTTQLTIGVDDRTFEVESRVVRIWSPPTPGGTAGSRQFVSFQFLGNLAARENILGRKIFQLERTQIKNKIR